jgi:hypothetical protein
VTRTVDDLRDDVRRAVGRHERVESTAFTKEALAAICEAVGAGVDGGGRLPPKARMRADILRAVGRVEAGEVVEVDRPFRKAELAAIAAAVETE